jgi:hypothetical protein
MGWDTESGRELKTAGATEKSGNKTRGLAERQFDGFIHD